MSGTHRWRWWHALPLAAALPVLGGAGICGVVLVDITQRDLILDPVDAITFEVDQGAVEVATLNRNGITLVYYMVGSLYDIGDVGHRVDGRTLEVFSLCDHPDFCKVSWTTEVMPGTTVDVVANDGDVKLIGTDAAANATVAGGGLEGAGLVGASLDANVDAGDVTLDYVAAPTSVVVVVGEGNVEITLPAAAYHCELTTGEGDVVTEGITCDATATNVVRVEVEVGDISLLPGAP